MTEQDAQQTTERWLFEAGIGKEMRILEVGCGPGAVTGLLLGCAWEAGQVVGLDRDEGLLAMAKERDAGRAVSLRRVDPSKVRCPTTSGRSTRSSADASSCT